MDPTIQELNMSHEASIKQVLKEFATAMYVWESDCIPYLHKTAKKSQLDESDMIEERRQDNALREVFKKYCVSWDSAERDSYGDPPDYHPDYFDILEVKVNGKKATAKVRQPALGQHPASKGGGLFPAVPEIYTYYLRMTDNGWRLEDRRDAYFENSGETIKTSL